MKKRQDDKKQIAWNTHLFLSLFLFLTFLGFSIDCAIEKEIGLCIAFAIFTLLPIFVFAVSPLFFLFSDEGVEIVYHFGQREEVKWNTVRNISLRGGWGASDLPHYKFAYPRKEKQLFFVVGEVPKTAKTKKLIKKYYKKEIT